MAEETEDIGEKKMKMEFWKKIKEKLSRIKEDTDMFDDWDTEELDSEDGEQTAGWMSVPVSKEGSLEEKLRFYRKGVLIRRGIAVGAAVLVVAGIWMYHRYASFDSYVIQSTYENTVASGTRYEKLGKSILRYNADGAVCVNQKNENNWNVTYSIQAPISSTCGSAAVVAEQQGSQIYVVNEDGVLGNFQTEAPILKVRVSRQGVVAVVLRDDNVTWINLYQSDGTLIASDKTTVMDSGYPVDLALSEDGEKMAVSYVCISGGALSGKIVFYDFGDAGQKQENHILSTAELEDTIAPELYYAGNGSVVVLTDQGFRVYSTSQKETASAAFEEEIISCFHEGDWIGFVFENREGDSKYKILLYQLSGKKKEEILTDYSYDKIKMENEQILMYNDRWCSAYTTAGHLRYAAEYEKDMSELFYYGDFRKYLIITKDSFDYIEVG